MPSPRSPHFRSPLVFFLGTVLLIFSAFFGCYAYVVVQALIWTQTSLLRGPVVMLCLVVAINTLFLRIGRRAGLSQSEMLALYAMVCVGTCAGGLGFVQILINEMAGVFYYANAGNHWKDTLWPHIPWWLAPRDPEVLNGFFRGRGSLYHPRILDVWAVPVLAWSSFIFGIFWVLLCATSLMRRRWVEEERLTFPLVALPLAMTDDHGSGTPFWHNRLMWGGFVLAGVLESINALSFLFPWVPSIPIKPIGSNILDQYFKTAPWTSIGSLRLAFYPWVIGIGYLLSRDISFSCWFTYLLVKLANVTTAAIGISEAGGGGGSANRAPYIREQGAGAFLCIAFFSLYIARGSVKRAWLQVWQAIRRAVRPMEMAASHREGDERELMPPAVALLGGGLGMVFLAGFLVAAGLSPPAASLFVLVYVCFSITLARIVSEAGAGWAWGPNWTVTSFVADCLGTNNLGIKEGIVLFGYTDWTNDMRDNPMPQMMQGARLAAAGDGSVRVFLWPLVWASAFGVIAAFWAHLHVYYIYGAATGKVRPWLSSMGISSFQHATHMIVSPPLRDVAGMVAAGFGALLVGVLTLLRQRLPWWPLHPIGYALATTSSMDYMWFPFFLAWLAKTVTLRWNGIRGYRDALPFFLGMILGDYVVPSLWGIIGMISGSQQYMAFPH